MIETTWVEINLDNIKKNYNSIKNKIQDGVRVCGVVKANAYGHGAVEVSKVLESEGVDYIAVARLEEAMELREAGVGVPIMCLGYIYEQNYRYAIENDITITLYCYENAKKLDRVAREMNRLCKVHIKIDTGMGRLGFLVDEESVEAIVEINKLKNIYIEGIYTHFSKADEKEKSYTKKQIDRFDNVYEKLESRGVNIPIRHVSNSAGVIDFSNLKYEMIRCGIALYGHYPSEEVTMDSIDLVPAMSFKTRVASIKKIGYGEQISYGGKYELESDAYIAVLPVGYADGFFRSQASPQVKIRGEIYDVVGRICMDQCMVDLGVTSQDIRQGDEVEIFGVEEGLRVEDIAQDVNTINYEIMCAISRRVDRVYIENGNKVKENYIIKKL